MYAIPYSQAFVPKGPRVHDSDKLRARVAVVFDQLDYQQQLRAYEHLRKKLGTPNSSTQVPFYLKQCLAVDFLSAVSHIANGLQSPDLGAAFYKLHSPQTRWVQDVAEAFHEENAAFKVLDNGSVVPFVDQEFVEQVAETIVGMSGDRYKSASGYVHVALAQLKAPVTFGEAIASVFKAAENVFKMSSDQANLGKGAHDFYRKNWVDALPQTERNAAGQMLNSLADWIVAAHNYRHADAEPAPIPPTRDFAVWMVSCGMAHIRWMVHVDTELQKRGAGNPRP